MKHICLVNHEHTDKNKYVQCGYMSRFELFLFAQMSTQNIYF